MCLSCKSQNHAEGHKLAPSCVCIRCIKKHISYFLALYHNSRILPFLPLIVPENMSVNVTSSSPTSITLHWVVERSMQHQLPILHFSLTYSLAAMDHSSNIIVLPSNVSQHKVIGLIPDKEYTLSVSAHNQLGTGLKHRHNATTSKGKTLHVLLCIYVYTPIHTNTHQYTSWIMWFSSRPPALPTSMHTHQYTLW